jgi:hypothetical protein
MFHSSTRPVVDVCHQLGSTATHGAAHLADGNVEQPGRLAVVADKNCDDPQQRGASGNRVLPRGSRRGQLRLVGGPQPLDLNVGRGDGIDRLVPRCDRLVLAGGALTEDLEDLDVSLVTYSCHGNLALRGPPNVTRFAVTFQLSSRPSIAYRNVVVVEALIAQ